ncbi:hypothetical protein Sliba_58780 [Streptomyces nigrescens]|uniref:Uncharacterized protein n=1 Tax=Streptomyces nigrescens TaxID=1920 RepID=A0A640TTI4_STRNI|nr:hypothetical protein Sliba_58780 [Streptomyces libani subsp. libani]GGV98095.1 hypothetical protein GCM10010500_45530 [Streptomyces libani subsp. libani]
MRSTSTVGIGASLAASWSGRLCGCCAVLTGALLWVWKPADNGGPIPTIATRRTLLTCINIALRYPKEAVGQGRCAHCAPGPLVRRAR